MVAARASESVGSGATSLTGDQVTVPAAVLPVVISGVWTPAVCWLMMSPLVMVEPTATQIWADGQATPSSSPHPTRRAVPTRP